MNDDILNDEDWPLRKWGIEPDPVIEAYKKDVDVTLLIENLKLTPTERVRKLRRSLRLVEAFREAGRRSRGH